LQSEKEATYAAISGDWGAWIRSLVPAKVHVPDQDSEEKPMRKKKKTSKKFIRTSKPRTATTTNVEPVQSGPEEVTHTPAHRVSPPTLACALTEFITVGLLHSQMDMTTPILTAESKHPHEPAMEMTKRYVLPVCNCCEIYAKISVGISSATHRVSQT